MKGERRGRAEKEWEDRRGRDMRGEELEKGGRDSERREGEIYRG